MAKPLVAIVGRPNVGKSMLFNKLTGQRTSIVEDTPGVTRDRIYGSCEWCGRTFSLVDTGGIEPGTDSEMLKFMRRQAEIGIELADAIIMVVDVHSGVTAADQDVATMLRKSGKPIALAVNKCDSVGPVNPDVYEFYSLGIGDLFETSAIHGHGTGDLLDWVLENIPEDSGEEEDSDVIKVAIVGKPNVGKSSLLNRILGEERVIVSDVAGTTRDAIDSYFENETGKYCFIDTAGMRRKSKVDDAIEKYSNMRSISAIDRADVCLILIDANDGVTEQDTKIAGLVHEAGKAAVIVVNKWDAVENKETNTMPIFVKYAASQYEDEFLNAQEMKYFSKNGRTPQSPEFQWALSGVGPDWGRTHFVPLFVMRKAEEADGKYYYVGHVAAFDNPTLTTKPNAAGDGTVKVTLSTLRLARPLDPELYRHLVG